MDSLDIVTIATNQYVDYWIEMVKSADLSLDSSCEIKSFVFTDDKEKCLSVQESLRHIAIEVISIESLKWPDATLLRYKVFHQFSSRFESEYIMHLDADMIVRKDFIIPLRSISNTKDVLLTAHPGYFRPKRLKRVKLYLKNPEILIQDLKATIKIGGVGSWETSKDSSAYVPRNNRNVYVCGGTWLGKSSPIKKLIKELAENVEDDKKNGKMAIWHDESHLNRWAIENDFYLLQPSFCSDPTYKQLEGLPVYIQAVDKSK